MNRTQIGRTARMLIVPLALLSLNVPLALKAQQPADVQKRIADLEKQVTELQKAIADLKGQGAKTAQKPIELADMAAWKSIRGFTVSDNGEWYGYRLGPAEGDGEVIIRQVKGTKEYKFPAGGSSAGSGLSSGSASFFGGGPSFSHDGRWASFTIYPPHRATQQRSGSTSTTPGPTSPSTSATQQTKTALLNLGSGEKIEYEGIRRTTFSGESATHVALHKTPPASSSGDSPSSPAGIPAQIAAALGRTVTPSRSSGSDLILRDLANGTELTIGSVGEFTFDKKGRILIVAIDSPGQTGNGIQLRNLATGVQVALDSGKATYSRFNWSEDGEAFACLKGIEDKAYEGKLNSLLAVTNVAAAKPEKTIFDPAKDAAFPKEMTISGTNGWLEDRSAIFFGIQSLKKKGEGGREGPASTGAPDRGRNGDDFAESLEEPPPGPRRSPSAASGQTEKPDLVIWHWKDPRLQSMQQVQASSDRDLSYLCVYHLAQKKFIRLADEKLRRVSAPDRGKWAVGTDDQPYELQANLDGRRFRDVYVVDTTTGERKKALTKNRWLFGPSPDEQHLLYYEDGHFHTYEMATGKTYNITKDTPVSFVDTEDDHNVDRPPTRQMGWSKDSQWLLLSDNWDVWKVPVHGGPGVNLTADGKKEGIRYGSRMRLDPEEKGADLAAAQYFTMLGEHTKKAGFALLEPGKSEVKRLVFDDAVYGSLTKPENAELLFYTRQTHKDYPDWYWTDKNFAAAPTRITNAFPEQDKYLWSSGVRLLDYTSKNGDKLQAALSLPANYEAGKSYPCIVYIYEQLSDGLNRYTAPSPGGLNQAHYTSQGYAVLMPDINYKINDPGMSAVACVLPAIDAAVATGVVDRTRIGLHGHSWGGYQTAFLITQTNVFKAAVAGAPLTNMISMYSSIYWNSGSANQPIFESSQGRFNAGYMDNPEAYTRNSPVYHAKNVQTPLIILHNDKDGAVDFNQGIEYFNTLRRLQKPVVLLQYKGENHGLTKTPNRKDYTVRMKEFFDHHLMGKPAPDWLKEGVPHLKIDEHLKAREPKPAPEKPSKD